MSKRLQSSEKLESDSLSSHSAVRWFIKNMWFFSSLLFIGVFLAIVFLMNSLDLHLLIYPRIIQLLLAFLMSLGFLTIPYRIWHKTFKQAKNDVELFSTSQALVKYTKRFLKKCSTFEQNQPKTQLITERLSQLLQSIQNKQGISFAMKKLQESLPHQQTKPLFQDYIRPLFIAMLIAVFIRGFLIGNYKIPSGSMLPTLQIGDHLIVSQFIYGLRLPFTTWKIGTHIREPKRGEVIVFQNVVGEPKDLIKRVIAIPGDIIDIQKDRIYLNRNPLPQTLISSKHDYVNYHEKTEIWCQSEAALYQETNQKHDHFILQQINPDDVYSENRNFLTQENTIEKSPLTDTIETICQPMQNPEKSNPYPVKFPCKVPKDHVFVMGDHRDNSHDSRYFGPVPYGHIKGKALFIWWSDGAKPRKNSSLPHCENEEVQIDSSQPWVRFERLLQWIQ